MPERPARAPLHGGPRRAGLTAAGTRITLSKRNQWGEITLLYNRAEAYICDEEFNLDDQED